MELSDGSYEEFNFKEYQDMARTTAIYPRERAIEYLILGLVSEAGEVAGKYKKVLRDSGGIITPEKAREMAFELGDVLWYIANLADEFKDIEGFEGFHLGHIAGENMNKLLSRKERGVLGGSGDNR